MSLGRLQKLVPPPKTPHKVGTEDEWRSKESSLRISLPREYMQLCQAYGTGWFDVNGRQVALINLFDKAQIYTIKGNLGFSESIKARQPKLFENGDSIYLWGAAFDCLNLCFVLQESGAYRILAYPNDYDELQMFDMTLPDFCVEMLSAKIEFSVIPAKEFEGDVAFRQYPRNQGRSRQ